MMVNNHHIILHQISILLWNANGLLQQINELKAFITENKLDIILVSEAHLTPHSTIRIPGYSIYHCDHPDGTAHTGSAIIIKSSISHAILPHFQSTCFQATNISISLNHIPTTISSVYCPPGNANKITDDDFTLYFQSLGNTFLAGGDFNSKHQIWGSRVTNTRGRSLYSSLLTNNLKHFSPPGQTYWPSHLNRVPDILDFFVHTLPNHINYNLTNLSDLSSDHTPLLLTLNIQHVSLKTFPTLTPGKTNWNKFSHIVEKNISLNIPLKSTFDIDSAILALTNVIKNAKLDSSPPSITPYNNKSLPEYLSQLLAVKRRARNRWQRTHLPSDKRYYNNITCSLKNLFANITVIIINTILTH